MLRIATAAVMIASYADAVSVRQNWPELIGAATEGVSTAQATVEGAVTARKAAEAKVEGAMTARKAANENLAAAQATVEGAVTAKKAAQATAEGAVTARKAANENLAAVKAAATKAEAAKKAAAAKVAQEAAAAAAAADALAKKNCAAPYQMMYEADPVMRNWADSLKFCESKNADGPGWSLASITTDAEDASAKAAITGGNLWAWIGFKRTTPSSEVFEWTDGRSNAYVNGWGNREPSGDGGCAEVLKQGRWNDFGCSGLSSTLCGKCMAPAPASTCTESC